MHTLTSFTCISTYLHCSTIKRHVLVIKCKTLVLFSDYLFAKNYVTWVLMHILFGYAVLYLQNNPGGITIFGWTVDRALINTIFFIELSLVTFVLGKTIVFTTKWLISMASLHFSRNFFQDMALAIDKIDQSGSWISLLPLKWWIKRLP